MKYKINIQPGDIFGRLTIEIFYLNERTIAKDWLKVLPIKRSALYNRLNKGENIEQILNEFNLKITIQNGIIIKII